MKYKRYILIDTRYNIYNFYNDSEIVLHELFIYMLGALFGITLYNTILYL
jgi:hypothetical protein